MSATMINMSTLVRLADKDVEQQVTDFGSLPMDIRQSLERQMQERRTEVVDAAAGEIVNLLQTKDNFLTTQATAIQRHKESIKALEDMMAAVQKATEYGLSSQNFLPLAKAVGLGTPSGTKAELLKIPAGWVAPVEPAPEAPAAA